MTIKDANVDYLGDTSALERYSYDLIENGYLPSQAMTKDEDGKITHKVRFNYWRHHKLIQVRDTAVLLEAASDPDNVHHGIGVHLPHTTVPGLKLGCFDVDFKFEVLDPNWVLAKCLASVVNQPVPTRVGGKGLGMFFTMPDDLDVAALNSYRKTKGVTTKVNMGDGSGFLVENHGLSDGHHMVLPPSLYPDLPDRNYEWMDFPSVNPSKQVELRMFDQTDDRCAVHGLPVLDHWALMECVLHATTMRHQDYTTADIKNWSSPEPPQMRANPLRDFILADPWSKGSNYRELKMLAVHFMIMEGFDPTYVRKRFMQILQDHHGIERDPDWGSTDAQYETQLDQMIAGSVTKRDEQGGAKPSKRRADPKVPEERKIFEWMLEHYPHDQCRRFNGMAYRWREGTWRKVDMMAPQVIRNILDAHPMATGSQVHKGMQLWGETLDDAPEPQPTIAFPNGSYDPITKEFRPALMEDYNPFVMRAEYNPDAACVEWERHISRMFNLPLDVRENTEATDVLDEKRRAMETFEEYIGYCLSSDTSLQHVLFLIGATATGKSVVWKVMHKLFPPQSIGGVAYEDLGNATSRSGLIGKVINIGREVGRRAHLSDQALLALTSGDPVEVHTMHVSRVQVELKLKLIFDGNKPPSSSDTEGAFQRRAIILRTTSDPIPEAERIPEFEAKLAEELPGIVTRWLNAYQRLRDRANFDPPNYAREEGRKIAAQANSAVQYINEYIEQGDQYYPLDLIFKDYMEWCIQTANRPMPSNMFSNELTAMGYGSVQKWLGGKNLKVRKLKLNPVVHPTLSAVRDSY